MFFLVYFRQIDMEMTKKGVSPAEPELTPLSMNLG